MHTITSEVYAGSIWIGDDVIRDDASGRWVSVSVEIINNDRMSGWQFSAGLRKEL